MTIPLGKVSIEMSKNLCPHCDEVVEFESISRREEYPLKKGVVDILVQLSRCPACGGTFTDMKQADFNYELAVEVYRKDKGLLTPEKIKEVRVTYGLSQRRLGDLLGWSQDTLVRYEQGKIQDQAHNDVLLFLQSPGNMKRLLGIHRKNLDEKVAAKLEERVKELMVEEQAALERHQLNSLYDDVPIGKMTGNRSFDLHRFVQAAVYMLKRSGPEFKTKLLKLFFFLDFLAFKLYNNSITGAVYVHLEHGPVPDQFQTLLNFMVQSGKLDIEVVYFDQGDGEKLSTKASPDTSCFSKDQINILDTVVDTFKEFSAKEMRDCSHKEAAYEKTELSEKISYEFAKELSLD